MIKKYNETYRATYKKFESISDLISTINNSEIHTAFVGSENSEMLGARRKRWTQTENYKEAEELLLHGWDYMAKELTTKLDALNNGTGTKQKNVYDVVGYQACVPRYLQGVPTNMVRSKTVQVKNKVIVLNKNIGYSSATNSQTIIDESIKALKLVRSLEAKGYKVELNIVLAFGKRFSRCYESIHAELDGLVIKVCIKKASQRLNVKQTAFPLVHPSMLRRIIFKLIERSHECGYPFVGTYGTCTNENHNIYKELFKGEYMIPRIVSEDEITDIEKYKI